MRIGIACPYSWDVPGGVGIHIRDLAEELIRRGHEVGVVAPSEALESAPDYLTPTGSAIPVPYNGSIARTSRLTRGPATSTSSTCTSPSFPRCRCWRS